jgi:hypothetical protein
MKPENDFSLIVVEETNIVVADSLILAARKIMDDSRHQCYDF